MKKILTIMFLLFIVFGIGWVINDSVSSFERLSLEEMQQRVVKERDLGIKKAIAQGVYHCCVEPACTMCFMEGNVWNNQKAGTCACTDLINKNKEPCPQCKRILNETKNSTCGITEQECKN